MPALLIVAAVVLIIFIIIYGRWAAEKRRKDLAAWAGRCGLEFHPEKHYGWDDIYSEFDCLCEGDNRYAQNVSTGPWKGRRSIFFDYHYETHSTDSKGQTTTHHHHFSAVIVESTIPLRPLFIRPEGFFDKITQFFGYDDIDFESAEFSRKFYVKSPDRKWAYDVIHARTMEFLLQMPPVTMKFDRGNVIAYQSSRFSPGKFECAADVVCGILDRLPEYVIRQQTGGLQS